MRWSDAGLAPVSWASTAGDSVSAIATPAVTAIERRYREIWIVMGAPQESRTDDAALSKGCEPSRKPASAAILWVGFFRAYPQLGLRPAACACWYTGIRSAARARSSAIRLC